VYFLSAPMKDMYLSWASTGRRNVPFLETKKRKKCHPGHYARAWIHATAIVEGGRDEVCNCLIACAWLHTATAIEGGREVACSRCHSGSSHRQSGLDPCRLGLDLHRCCRQWGEGRSPATTLSRGGGGGADAEDPLILPLLGPWSTPLPSSMGEGWRRPTTIG
jgi:hypothetical protein